MKVVYLVEWDNPKAQERNEKRLKFQKEVKMPHWEKMLKEKDIKVKENSWSDNTGHRIILYEFETMEDFNKFWEDERWQQIMARWNYFIDNVRIRLLRPAFRTPLDIR